MQRSQRTQRALEREKRKLAASDNPSQNRMMTEQLGDKLRAYMEQNEKTSQLLLQTLQNMSNTISNLKPNQATGRDITSNHYENDNRAPLGSTPRITRPSFVPRKGSTRKEEEINAPNHNLEELTESY